MDGARKAALTGINGVSRLAAAQPFATLNQQAMRLQKEVHMARYVVLLNFTDQGMRSVKNTVDRARAAREAFQGMGVKMTGVWWTIGPYDVVCTLEAPDDETLTRAGLALGMQGNVRSTTLRAFDEGEMTQILQGLPG